MDQGLVTVIVGIVSASAAIFSPIIPKWIENKNKIKQDDKSDLEKLANRYRIACEQLWDVNGDVLLAYWNRLQIEEYPSEYIDEDPFRYKVKYANAEEDVAKAEKKYDMAMKEAEDTLFSIRIKYPALQESAQSLLEYADPQPKRDPFDNTVFINGLKRMIIEHDDGSIYWNPDLQQSYDEAVKRFTEEVRTEYERLK